MEADIGHLERFFAGDLLVNATRRNVVRNVEKLKTAVAEATMNAMEHGNGYDAEMPVHLSVAAGREAVTVRITDQGGASRQRMRSISLGGGSLGKPIFGTSAAMTCQKAR